MLKWFIVKYTIIHFMIKFKSRIVGWSRSTRGGLRNATFSLKSLKGRNNLEDLGVNGRIIFK
jgi:hypothetical protein